MPVLENYRFRNILMVRNDRFGEFLLNIPALRALKNTFQSAKITAIVAPQVKALAQCVPFIDQVWPWDSGFASFAGRLSLLRKLKSEHFDLAVVLNPSKEFHLIAWFCGIRVRLGYNRKYGFLLTHKIPDLKFLGHKHEVLYNLDLVSLVDAYTSDLDLSLELKVQDTFCQYMGSIVIHPWTSDPVKQWPLENFVELAGKITRQLDIKVILVGGQDEQKYSGVFSAHKDKVTDLTGKTTLVELASVLQQSSMLVSADSGPMHLAAAVGTGVIALFRNDIPGKTAQRWGPWGDGHTVIEKSSLNLITVEEVFAAVKNKLRRKGNQS